MPDTPHFIETQLAFSAHLRAPLKRPIPEGVATKRVEIYQELLFNNINNILSSAFPILRRIYTDKNWYGMVRDFLAKHKASSPIFHEISKEFLHYLQYVRENEHDPAWLYELAHYEWIEMALQLSQAQPSEIPFNKEGNLMQGVPVVSKLASIQLYAHPVHTISENSLPVITAGNPTCLVIYRNLADDVAFMHINDFTYALLCLLSEDANILTGEQALNQLIELTNHPNPAMVISGGAQTLNHLRPHDIILGTKR